MRRLLAPAVVLCALLAPATANAGIPFTVGEGRFPHVALDAAETAHVVWTNTDEQVFHCRLPRGAADCQPLTTRNAGAGTASAFALIGSGSNVHIAVPNGAIQKTDLFTSTDGGMTWGPLTKIYSWGGGAGRTEPVAGP